jgi:hypothetical protein
MFAVNWLRCAPRRRSSLDVMRVAQSPSSVADEVDTNIGAAYID